MDLSQILLTNDHGGQKLAYNEISFVCFAYASVRTQIKDKKFMKIYIEEDSWVSHGPLHTCMQWSMGQH